MSRKDPYKIQTSAIEAFIEPDDPLVYAKAHWDEAPRDTYGLENIVDWEVLESMTQWQIERLFYMDERGLRTNPPEGVRPLREWNHLHNMIICDFPPDGNNDWQSNYWTAELCYWFCHDKLWLHVNGAGATGKSKAFAFVIYEYIKASPSETFVYMTSDQIDSLVERCWKYLVEAHKADLNPIGRCIMRDNKPALMIESETRGNSGLRCISFEKGPDAVAKVKKAIGAHAPRMAYIMEEGNACPPAAFLAISNMMKGCDDFKIVSLQNPTDYTGDLGSRQVPINHALPTHQITPIILAHGDPSHVPCMVYECEDGVVMHTDPRRSPAMTHPEGVEEGQRRFPWYESQESIDKFSRDLNTPGKEYEVYTQGLGLVPPGGTQSVVVTTEAVVRGRAQEEMPVAFQPSGRVAGIDWAFDGGNKAVAILAEYGQMAGFAGTMINVLKMEEHQSGSGSLLITQLVDWGVNIVNNWLNGSTYHLGTDSTGNGGLIVTQRIEEILGRGAYYVISSQQKGINERGRIKAQRKTPLTRHDFLSVSDTHEKLAKDHYSNRSTEILKTAGEFISAGQVRNLPDLVAKQLTTRPMHPGSPLKVFSKKEADPSCRGEFDHGDAFSIVTTLLRERFSIHPGGTTPIEMEAATMAQKLDEMEMQARSRMIEKTFHEEPTSQAAGQSVFGGRTINY